MTIISNKAKNLVRVHSSPFNYEQFCENFVTLKQFKLIGSGYFSFVYGSQKDNYVYKLGRLQGIPKKDPYLNYIKAVHNKKNPYFPKIKNLDIFKGPGAYFYVAKIEKLFQCDNEILLDNSADVRDNLIDLFHQRKNSNIIDEWQYYAENYLKYKNIIAYELFSTMKKLLKDHDCDLHSENMMMRQNGQLVISDPLCPKGMKTPYF